MGQLYRKLKTNPAYNALAEVDWGARVDEIK